MRGRLLWDRRPLNTRHRERLRRAHLVWCKIAAIAGRLAMSDGIRRFCHRAIPRRTSDIVLRMTHHCRGRSNRYNANGKKMPKYSRGVHTSPSQSLNEPKLLIATSSGPTPVRLLYLGLGPQKGKPRRCRGLSSSTGCFRLSHRAKKHMSSPKSAMLYRSHHLPDALWTCSRTDRWRAGFVIERPAWQSGTTSR